MRRNRISIITLSLILFGSVLGGCQLKDPEQRIAAREVQRKCDNSAAKKYPVLNVTQNHSEPVYVNVPTGEIICSTEYVRQPNVVPGVGVLSHKPKSTCAQKTSRQFSHNRTWQEIVDQNAKKRSDFALACKKDWCEANFDNKYWSAGYNDAELCVRTK